ncbi:MAG: hypothetical protein PHD15_00620 [Clostridia bacterium]|nr:hypothetical protein [Clostridia bacterium]MDD4386253.1 hypothetical protein [Clostridia bacterium]
MYKNNAGPSVTNSTAWGNYNDSLALADIVGHGSLQISGYSEYMKAKKYIVSCSTLYFITTLLLEI